MNAYCVCFRLPVHVRYMSSEVEPCVVWALRVSLPFERWLAAEEVDVGVGGNR
jgi:hypothetical protein